MESRQPTIYDVAEAAGVSIATVSRVMAGKSASEASRQKVQEAMRSLGYRPSAGPHAGESAVPVLALVASDLTNPYFAVLAAGAEREAREGGFALQVYVNDLLHTASEDILQRLLAQRLDGAVLVGGMIENGPQEQAREVIRRVQERMPVVTIGPMPQDVQCVNITSDLSVSVKKSLDYLVSMGHRRIAFIGGNRDGRSACIRERAFAAEMTRRGLAAPDELQNVTGFTPQAGELAVTKLFTGKGEAERPTALIAINDLVALGALRQLRRMGLRVPADVSLIGCDNQFFTPYLDPPLTTADLHPYDHGRAAVAELIALKEGSPSYSFSQIHECSLIVRGSCCPPAC